METRKDLEEFYRRTRELLRPIIGSNGGISILVGYGDTGPTMIMIPPEDEHGQEAAVSAADLSVAMRMAQEAVFRVCDSVAEMQGIDATELRRLTVRCAYQIPISTDMALLSRMRELPHGDPQGETGASTAHVDFQQFVRDHVLGNDPGAFCCVKPKKARLSGFVSPGQYLSATDMIMMISAIRSFTMVLRDDMKRIFGMPPEEVEKRVAEFEAMAGEPDRTIDYVEPHESDGPGGGPEEAKS